MSSLSVIMITKNEESNLRRALESVKFADEIIINDSGSTDRTFEIAAEYKAKIIKSQFAGFGRAKQLALEQATCEWVLSIDADEELDEELTAAVKAALSSADFAAYYLNRKSQFLDRWIMHSGWYPDHLVRMFHRGKGTFSADPVHETIQVNGKIGNLKGHLLHHTDPDVEHYLEKLNRYTTLSAQSLFDQGRKASITDLLFRPPVNFIKMYISKAGFLDGTQGLLLALLSSFHVLVKYGKLWELRRR